MADAQAKFDHIRIGPQLGVLAFHQFHRHQSLVGVLGAADVIFKDEAGIWWPRSVTYEAFNRILAEKGEEMGLDSSVMVVGAGAEARVAIAALSRAGFSHFNITSDNKEEADKMIASLKRKFFDSQFDFIDPESLILLPGSSGLVVNTLAWNPGNQLLCDLSYFNFLKRDGHVWDMTLLPPMTQFIKDASDVGIGVVRGYHIASWSDWFWVKWVSGLDLGRSRYCQALKSHLDQFPSSLVEPD